MYKIVIIKSYSYNDAGNNREYYFRVDLKNLISALPMDVPNQVMETICISGTENVLSASVFIDNHTPETHNIRVVYKLN